MVWVIGLVKGKMGKNCINTEKYFKAEKISIKLLMWEEVWLFKIDITPTKFTFANLSLYL